MPLLRYFFEYGVDTVLWPDDVSSELGYPCVDVRAIPHGTSDELTRH